MRVQLVKRGQHVRQNVRAANQRERHAQQALIFARNLRHFAVELALEIENPLRFFHIALARIGQLILFAHAVEKRNAHIMLQVLQKLCQRRLRNIQRLGGCDDRTIARQRDYIIQIAKVHAKHPRRYYSTGEGVVSSCADQTRQQAT